MSMVEFSAVAKTGATPGAARYQFKRWKRAVVVIIGPFRLGKIGPAALY